LSLGRLSFLFIIVETWDVTRFKNAEPLYLHCHLCRIMQAHRRLGCRKKGEEGSMVVY
jgi:hypothetical protein